MYRQVDLKDKSEKVGSNFTIHIINPFQEASGGSEWRALMLYENLKKFTSVELWATGKPNSHFSKYPIKIIDLLCLRFPKKGTLIFVGIYFYPGKWIHFTFPKRNIVIFNTFNLRRGHKILKSLAGFFKPEPELVYASADVADQVAISGVIHPSPICLNRFSLPPVGSKRNPNDPLVVGRISRDASSKHHPQDPKFYHQLAGLGFDMRIMGGLCLKSAVADHPRIHLLPACAYSAEKFLQGLDVFFYRTSPEWDESWGRVIFEAMACGLPVVAESRGGYRNAIEHGKNGFLFEDQEEALDILKTLKKDPDLRLRVGGAARATVAAMFSNEEMHKQLKFYLQ